MSPIESIGSMGYSGTFNIREALGTLPRDPRDVAANASQIADILRKSEGAVLFIGHEDKGWAENLEGELRMELQDILGSGTTLYSLLETNPHSQSSHLIHFSLSPLPRIAGQIH